MSQVGLRPKTLRNLVRTEKPKSLKAAEILAVEYDADDSDISSDDYQSEQNDSDDSYDSPSQRQKKKHANRPHKSKSQNHTKKTDNEGSTNKIDTAIEKLVEEFQSLKIYLTEPQPFKRRCFNCQQGGHQARDCPQPCKLCHGQEGPTGPSLLSMYTLQTERI